jgi:transposase
MNRAKPTAEERGVFGPKLISTAAWLQGKFCMSRKDTQTLVNELFGIELSTGTLSNQRRCMGSALLEPVMEAEEALQTVSVCGMDETSYGMRSGRGWLWVLTSRWLTVFRLHARRNREAATRLLDSLLGDSVLVTDRYGVYRYLPNEQHQLCWAHLHRDFLGWSEHANPQMAWLGARLSEDTEEVFRLVARIRDGTLEEHLARKTLQQLRTQMEFRLRLGTRFCDERTRHKVHYLERDFALYWTFMNHPGVPLTNNDAERALRHAVILRKTSFGVHSCYGALFVECILSVLHSLKAQGRDARAFLRQALLAHFGKSASPSLLPAASIQTD